MNPVPFKCMQAAARTRRPTKDSIQIKDIILRILRHPPIVCVLLCSFVCLVTQATLCCDRRLKNVDVRLPYGLGDAFFHIWRRQHCPAAAWQDSQGQAQQRQACQSCCTCPSWIRHQLCRKWPAAAPGAFCRAGRQPAAAVQPCSLCSCTRQSATCTACCQRHSSAATAGSSSACCTSCSCRNSRSCCSIS